MNRDPYSGRRPGPAAGLAADAGRLRASVAGLPWPRHRQERPLETSQAERTIVDTLESLGWRPARVAFDPWGGHVGSGKAEELPGVNILSVREGSKSRDALIVEAHYDTVRDSPGADDNGSGVAVLLEAACLLSRFEFERTVLLAFTDFEERGFLGAAHLVHKPPGGRKLAGALILESVGYYDPTPGSQQLPAGLEVLYPLLARQLAARRNAGDWLAVVTQENSRRLGDVLVREMDAVAGKDFALVLSDPAELAGPSGRGEEGKALRRLMMMADHVPFWEAGLPAVLVTDTAFLRSPNYHKPTDTPDTLDYNRMALLAAGLASSVAILAGGRPAAKH